MNMTDTNRLDQVFEHREQNTLCFVFLLGCSAAACYTARKGCMAASASGNSAAGLRNQIRLVGVYGQLVGLRLPL
jgi:hypothetical protein